MKIMSKLINDEKSVEEFLQKGVAEIFPGKEALKKRMMMDKPMTVYCGFDPSAASLHIGNAILLNKLGQLQQLGHRVIFLIGDFTGMIGDPTDKSATRKKLTREEVLANAKNYKQQASGYLHFEGENPAQIRYNSEWSDKMTFRDLIELSSNFTVQQMIQRDMFKKRMEEEKPIYLHEFLYPLAQGYDSVAMDVDLEIGGNDQMFNMLCGRDLMQVLKKKEKFVLTMKLLADDSGKKMGKSEGNAVFLDQTPEDMYGRVMSWADGVLGVAFELCTDLPMAEVQAVYQELKDPSTNPRDIKMRLAFAIVRMNHGQKEAQKAQDYFIKTIQKKEVPEDIKTVILKQGDFLTDVLVAEGLAASKGDARRKIQQGGVKLDETVVSDSQLKVEVSFQGKILKVGKREFRKIEIVNQ